MILVKNCPHNNGIYTYLSVRENVVIKSSHQKAGIKSLEREYNGYTWYCDITERSEGNKLSIRTSGHFARLIIPLINGRTGCFVNGLHANSTKLECAFLHYSNYWPLLDNGESPLHGDLSLGNIIFAGNSAFIIDWEHFTLRGGVWGFDLLNLLYETAYFSFRGSDCLSNLDSNTFLNILNKYRREKKWPVDFVPCLDSLLSFIEENKAIWGHLINKLPVTKFTIKQKEFLRRLELQ